jgi:RimJ/RimL family protein N-acetyltransferase
MNISVEIRPLQLNDAYVSVDWRNNSKIWETTVSKPNRLITIEDELNWMRTVLNEKNSERFAIIADNNYVGNVQLTNIEGDSSYFGIFIGNLDFWGKGVGSKATELVLNYGFKNLNLNKIHLRVKIENINAIKIYSKIGFEETNRDDTLIYMTLNKSDFSVNQ